MSIITDANNKRIREWKEGRQVYYIHSSRIKVVENVHLKSSDLELEGVLEEKKDKDAIDNTIVVRPCGEGMFSLVMGVKWLTVAKLLNKLIACVVVNEYVSYSVLKNRIGLISSSYSFPRDTKDIVPMSKILIPKLYIQSTPPDFKMEMCRDYFVRRGKLDKSVTVVPSVKREGYYILKDEYIRYLILKELKIENIPIKFLVEEVEENAKTKI